MNMIEYTGKFELDDHMIYMRELAKEYHKRCDQYDSWLWSYTNEYGENIPYTVLGVKSSNQNAIVVLRGLKSRIPQYMHSDLMKAIRHKL